MSFTVWNQMLKILFTILLISTYSYSQQQDTIFIASWNLENLYDTSDDPLKDDQEYLPSSAKEWDSLKLDTKMKNLADVIKLMNDGKGPDLLGVCEVENKYVLDLLSEKYLGGVYSVAHLESPDNRGIDNGLLYKSGKFNLLSEQGDTVHLEDGYPTRLIFNAVLKYGNDTFYVFVNHWPSRRSGEKETDKNRIAAASVLKNAVDEILNANPNAKIAAVGDFNDEPANTSLTDALQAAPVICESAMMDIVNGKSRLFNLSYRKFDQGEGSYKYQDDWNMLDQIIVSRNLLTGKVEYLCGSFAVFKPDIMVTKLGKYQGTARPTFGGKNYLAGFSDHFPVIAKFLVRIN